jgi:hypothetical protein
MPWRSKAQVRKLYATNPELANRWTREYGMPKNLPEHVGDPGSHHLASAMSKAARKVRGKRKR